MFRVTEQCNKYGVLINGSIAHQELEYPVKSAIIEYMKQRKYVISASSARVIDFAGNDQQIDQYCRTTYSDGLYLWTANDIYYFEKYGMRLNEDFINHVLEQEDKPNDKV